MALYTIVSSLDLDDDRKQVVNSAQITRLIRQPRTATDDGLGDYITVHLADGHTFKARANDSGMSALLTAIDAGYAVVQTWFPENAQLPGSGGAAASASNNRATLDFDAASVETAYFPGVAPSAIATDLTLILHYVMASATSGDVVLSVAMEAITPGDTTDLDAATSFATAQSVTETVPATAGIMGTVEISLDNVDGLVPGDLYRVSVSRTADDAGDTAAGDFRLLAAVLRSA